MKLRILILSMALAGTALHAEEHSKKRKKHERKMHEEHKEHEKKHHEEHKRKEHHE